jgi:hypothetical protein
MSKGIFVLKFILIHQNQSCVSHYVGQYHRWTISLEIVAKGATLHPSNLAYGINCWISS